MAGRSLLAFGAVVGIACGAIAGFMLGSGAREPAPPPSHAAPAPAPPWPATAAAGTRATTTSDQSQRTVVATDTSADLVSPALRAYAEAEARRGWAELRQDAMPDELLAQALHDYADQVRRLPAILGRRAAEDLVRRAEARMRQEAKARLLASGDGVELLLGIDGSEPETRALVASARFAELFQPRGGGTAVDGTRPRDGRLPDGAVISFPAGVFKVDDLASGNDPFPSDVVVRGAGIDATLLVLDAVRPRTSLRRFGIEDCTVFADSGITDVSGQPSVLSLQRVRVVGFDCGAGGSVALYLDRAAVLARGCRFEGGYGRNPGGYANLVRASTPLLARFDDCCFERMSLDNIGSETAAVFARCALTDLLDPPPRGPRYDSCRTTVLPEAQRWDANVRRRNLDDLFPQWQQRLQRR